MLQWLLRISLVLICSQTLLIADDYTTLENALQNSSIEVNKFKIPDLIYQLDEPTARVYFEKYFATNYMTGALKANISYPIFCWGNNHTNLQKAICPILVTQLDKFFTKHNGPVSINGILTINPQLHDHIFYMLVFLVDIANSDCLNNEYKIDLKQKLLAILDKSRLTSPTFQKIDKSKLPYVNSIKTQLLMSCFTFAKKTSTIAQLSQRMFLDGIRKPLLDSCGVLIIDNGGFDNKQLQGIRTYINTIPQHLRIPVAITCFDLLIDSEKNKKVSVHSFRCNGAFNVFDAKVGAGSSSQFPHDYKKVECDDFMIVLAHEYNHNVDGIFVTSSPELLAFKDRLLKMAGKDHDNYLRSMFENGFFSTNPQEFIASMANQFFCNSKDMLRMAIQHTKHGNFNQINQFVLMASIYSDATKTFFYEIDKTGRISSSPYPVKKQDGLVTSISMGTNIYQFKYADGIINEAISL